MLDEILLATCVCCCAMAIAVKAISKRKENRDAREKENYNDCFCIQCGAPLRLEEINSDGSRLYVCPRCEDIEVIVHSEEIDDWGL